MYFRISYLSLAIVSLVGCHSYTPMPVDLDEHLAAFQHRTPSTSPEGGLPRADAREMAKMFHPDARLARRRAGVATAQRDHAGAWADPQLQGNLQRILESVPYQWITSAQLGFTLPINGRLQKQRDLADRRRDVALVAAWAIEQRVANDLDAAWAAWTAASKRSVVFAATCDSLEQLELVANALVDAGSLSKPGARVFTLERSQKQAAQAMALATVQATRLEVLRRIGLHPGAKLDLQADLEVKPFVAEASARRTAIRNSPRLLLEQNEYAAAEANLLLQIRKQWPDLQLAPGWQEEEGQPRASLGFNLNLPIFTGNDPAIAKANADRELAAAGLRVALEQLTQELAIAEVRRTAANDQADRFAELLVIAKQQVEDGRQLAAAGQLDPMLILDALLRVHNVQITAIGADEAAALAAITINTLLTDPQSQAPAMSAGEER